jgi:hypothetical protein
MTLTPQDAAAALADIAHARSRSFELRAYQDAAPHFLLWGVIWLLGYGATDLAPHAANWVWLVAVSAGLIGGLLIGRATARRVGGAAGGRRYQRQFWGLAVIMTVFAFGVFAIMRPTDGRQVAAFWPLLMAGIYSALGLWIGTRLLITGIALAVLTLGGFLFLPAHFLLWMAVVGGSVLFLTGLWLRRA